MSPRRAKQIIYGVFYGIVWLLIFFGVYFLFFSPRGAQPSTPVAPTASPLAATGGVTVFESTSGHYTFLAKLSNPNTDFAGKAVDYSFDIYSDASGTLIESIPGQSFIYANEIKYLVLPNQVLNRAVDHAALSIKGVDWVWAAGLGRPPQFTPQ